jgi:ketosteroid isomerase-like protein
MRKEQKARLATVAILAVAALVALGQKNGWRLPDFRNTALVQRALPKPDPTPQDAVYAMLDAARLGDVKAYMNNYTGQMAVALGQSLAEATQPGFAKYLQDSNAAIKGVAIAEPQTLTDREVKVRVEYVYEDRNEAQTMYLEKGPGGWKIARVEGVERVKTLVPYGTPVQ